MAVVDRMSWDTFLRGRSLKYGNAGSHSQFFLPNVIGQKNRRIIHTAQSNAQSLSELTNQ